MGVRRAFAAVVFLACRPAAYVQPAPNEPHAVLQMRHVVHAQRGPNYGAATFLGEESIDERTLVTASHVIASDTWVLRIRPEVATFSVSGHSFHSETRMVQQSRQVPESYSCPQQQCSYMNGSSQCQTVYNTCTRYHTEYYTAPQTVTVDDDSCARRVSFAPQVGHTYAITFDYFGGGACQALCFEQVGGAQQSCPIVPTR